MIAANRIRWAGVFSNELNMPDLITDCAFDSDNSEVSTYLNREAVASESYDGRNKRIIHMKYTESFAPKFTFIKKGFGDFSQEDVRALLKYLTCKDTTGMLEVYHDDSNVISWCAAGNFSEIQLYKIANSRVIGVTATFDSCTPFALSDLYTVTKTITSTDNKITINIDTDDNQPVYPRITIQQKGTVVSIPTGATLNMYSDMVPNTVYHNGTNYYWKSDTPALVVGASEPNYGWTKVIRDTAYVATDEIKEDTVYYYTSDQKYRWIDPYTFKSSTSDPKIATTGVKITNRHYNFFNRPSTPVVMSVKNNTATETVVIDGANRLISSTNTKRIFGDDLVDWKWLPLYDGKNELTVEGNCIVVLEYRCVRKVGEY